MNACVTAHLANYVNSASYLQVFLVKIVISTTYIICKHGKSTIKIHH